MTAFASAAWDLIVIGAGPAGCAAAARALQLEPTARVLLLDKAAFPRDKTCGDGVAGAAISQLTDLDLPAKTIVEGYEPANRFRIRSPGGVHVARSMSAPVWVIPRAVFDARLLQAVLNKGATFGQHTVRKVEVESERVIVDDLFTATAVIGCDGAESAVRRVSGIPANPPHAMAIAIRGYGPELPGQDGAQLISLAAQHWPAYAWSFPIGNGQTNLGYGRITTGPQITRRELLEGLHDLLPGSDPHPESLRAHRLPLSTQRPTIGNGRVLLAGDAQSLINPLTGEGILYALISGQLAGAAALHGALAGAIYRRSLGRRLGRHLRHSTVLAHVTRWPAVMDAVLRGAANDQTTFEDLVGIGLHDGTITAPLVRAATAPRNWRATAALNPYPATTG